MSEEMVFCYVILHYMTDKDTIECVESIINKNEKCQIVIVDNYSNNGSFEKVKSIYENIDYIHFVSNDRNLGFAEGNNVGYKYARNILHADFIAVSNNDIIIESMNFISSIYSAYQKNPFHLLGPDIVSLVDGAHQNPMPKCNTNRKKVTKDILRYRILLLLSKLNFYDFLRSRYNRNTIKKTETCGSEQNVDFQLHGSFIVFSPNFVELEESAFRPGTFLYLEESLLYIYCKRKNYSMMYYPDIRVLHKEDSSTNSLYVASKTKREFILYYLIQSLKVYRKALLDYEKEE